MELSVGRSVFECAPSGVPAHPLYVFEAIRHFSCYYPDFDSWFWGRVVPGLSTGTRRVLTEIRGGELAGLVILKDDGLEKKICSLWVADRFVGTGMGVRLLAKANQLLGGKPVATVPEERIEALGPVLHGLGFTLTEVADGYYRPGRKEFVFNGYLQASSC